MQNGVDFARGLKRPVRHCLGYGLSARYAIG